MSHPKLLSEHAEHIVEAEPFLPTRSFFDIARAFGEGGSKGSAHTRQPNQTPGLAPGNQPSMSSYLALVRDLLWSGGQDTYPKGQLQLHPVLSRSKASRFVQSACAPGGQRLHPCSGPVVLTHPSPWPHRSNLISLPLLGSRQAQVCVWEGVRPGRTFANDLCLPSH